VCVNNLYAFNIRDQIRSTNYERHIHSIILIFFMAYTLQAQTERSNATIRDNSIWSCRNRLIVKTKCHVEWNYDRNGTLDGNEKFSTFERSFMITRVPDFYVRNRGRTSGDLRTWKWSAELYRSVNSGSLMPRALLGHFLRSATRINRDVNQLRRAQMKRIATMINRNYWR